MDDDSGPDDDDDRVAQLPKASEGVALRSENERGGDQGCAI